MGEMTETSKFLSLIHDCRERNERKVYVTMNLEAMQLVK